MAYTTGTVTSQEQILPGERNPSRYDVEVATELPEPTRLLDFKRSLLATEDASDAQNLMHLDLKATVAGLTTSPVLVQTLLINMPGNWEQGVYLPNGLAAGLPRPSFSGAHRVSV